MIDLDQNATTPLERRVFEAMVPHLRRGYGNASSGCRIGRQARSAVEESRGRIAACLGVAQHEIVFTSGGTESDNLALRGVLRAGAGDHVVTTAIEHHAVLATCQDLARQGCRFTAVRPDGRGVVSPEDVERAIEGRVALVSVMAANNETGVVQPLARIAEVARHHGVPVHSDAVQALGKVRFRPAELGLDLASFSAHKIGGPQGVGALYVRRGVGLAPLLTGGGQERHRRAGTENLAGIVGLAVAVELATRELQANVARMTRLRDRLEEGILAGVGDVTVNGKDAPRVANTSSLSFRGVDGEALVTQLDLQGFCVSTGAACATGESEPSHVLLAMGVTPMLARGTVRFSLGRRTKEAEIEAAVVQVVSAVERLRRISSLR